MTADSRPKPKPSARIADHGIVGNMETAALIAMDGTIDYLCWPRLDSPTVFARLLDEAQGGAFGIAPVLADARLDQLYVPGTKVLVTRWMAEAGSAEIADFMPHPEISGGLRCCLIRRVRATRGRVRFSAICRPRFDYAREPAQVAACAGGVLFAAENGQRLQLLATVPIECGEEQAHADFEIDQGEEVWFVLRDEDEGIPSVAELSASIEQTIAMWRRWAQRSNYRGRWREEVSRSALTLKLLTSAEHGSVAAAATFGLPEATGAGRNWDYRATWIRDASFTVYAFMRLGYYDEAERFREWVGKRVVEVAEGDQLRIMYAIDGSEAASEIELDHLAGHGGARPVRIGNGARGQTQLDIYGELMDSIYLSNKYGSAISHEGWSHTVRLVEHVRARWQEADAGIWEVRDAPREYLHSRLMCWVAIDRAVRLAVKRSLPAPIVAWAETRDLIAADIWDNFRHPEHGYFVQSKGGTELDAAVLMMPLVRFVSATDPVWLSTLSAVGAQLIDDDMVFRYRNADGLKGGEGAFTTCSFWYIECLARAGRLDEATLAMAKSLRHANHLGLFSEELDPRGEQLGNFPQALTHLAFISAAYFLDRRLDNPDGDTWQP